ncbi:MAG: BPSS1780 family membrane protein, partial [Gammaproteobacteria bacterium]
LEVRHLFLGFRYKTLELASIGGLQLLGMIAIALLVAGIAYVAMGDTGLDMVEAGLSPVMIVAVLIAVGLMLPLAMAVWFAPAFVVFDEANALQAMKLSFSACMLNLLPLTSYSVVLLLLTLLVALTFGLGFLVVVPVMVASVYAAYRDIAPSSDGQPLKN